MALWLKDMYLQLEFSPKAAILFVKKQQLESPDRQRGLPYKNVNDIFNIMRNQQ